MTCIVGIIEKEKVWIGGDSAGTNDSFYQVKRKDPKVFIHGPFIMGFTTSYRMGQILMFDKTFPLPKHPKGMDTYEFMVTTFIKSLRKAFKKEGYIQKTKDGEDQGGTFLVGYKGSLYEIQGDFQVSVSMHSYSAVGCGRELALGSLHATTHFFKSMKPKESIENALDAACEFSAGVSGPYVILSK